VRLGEASRYDPDIAPLPSIWMHDERKAARTGNAPSE